MKEGEDSSQRTCEEREDQGDQSGKYCGPSWAPCSGCGNNDTIFNSRNNAHVQNIACGVSRINISII